MLSHPTADEPGILISGGTGFLGGEVLARLLEADERPVYVLVRASSEEEAAARLRAAIASLFGGAERPLRRAVAVAADLDKPALGMETATQTWLAERTQAIIHCAASVSFTLGLEESRAINVTGTRRMLDFAESCVSRGSFECFSHVSTAYVAGTHRARFAETQLELEQGFRNPYERSKFEAELVVRERASVIPTQVLRPSIVVGDSRTGWTAAFNVVYAPLRALLRGAYRVLPARRSSPVDVVPVDYVADAIVALAGRPGTTYHLAAAGRASSVGEILDLACAYADQLPPLLLSPTVYRRAVHPILVRRGSEPRRRALRQSEVYFPYFEMRTQFDDERAREALLPLGIEAPPLRTYFERLIDFARAVDWGRRPRPRFEAAGP